MFTVPYWQYQCADASQCWLLAVQVLIRLLIEQTVAFEPDEDVKKAVALHTYSLVMRGCRSSNLKQLQISYSVKP